LEKVGKVGKSWKKLEKVGKFLKKLEKLDQSKIRKNIKLFLKKHALVCSFSVSSNFGFGIFRKIIFVDFQKNIFDTRVKSDFGQN